MKRVHLKVVVCLSLSMSQMQAMEGRFDFKEVDVKNSGDNGKNNAEINSQNARRFQATSRVSQASHVNQDSNVSDNQKSKPQDQKKNSEKSLSFFDETEIAKRSADQAKREQIAKKPIKNLSDLTEYVSYLLDAFGRFLDSMIGPDTNIGDSFSNALRYAKNDMTTLDTMLKDPNITQTEIKVIQAKAQEVAMKLSVAIKENGGKLDDDVVQKTIKIFNSDIQTAMESYFKNHQRKNPKVDQTDYLSPITFFNFDEEF